MGAECLIFSTGTSNTGVGREAGRTVTTADNCVMIGSGADGIATGDNQIAIGFDATCTKANQVIIGNTSIVETVLRGSVLYELYTIATLPPPTPGSLIYISNEIDGPTITMAFADGVNFRRVRDSVVLS